jgi:hypothetical protein
MKRIGPSDLTPTLRHFDMEEKEVDCFYEGTETVKSAKLQNGESELHTFSKIQDRGEKFAVWGYGLLDRRLKGDVEKNDPGVTPGTPIRLIYKGKAEAEVKTGKFGKKIKKDVHQCELYDITDEIEKNEITETKDNLIYA